MKHHDIKYELRDAGIAVSILAAGMGVLLVHNEEAHWQSEASRPATVTASAQLHAGAKSGATKSPTGLEGLLPREKAHVDSDSFEQHVLLGTGIGTIAVWLGSSFLPRKGEPSPLPVPIEAEYVPEEDVRNELEKV